VRLLLAQPGIDVNAVDEDGRTALWHAAAQGGYDEFTIRYRKKKYLEEDALQIARMLIAAGADESIADKSGTTPLDVARKISFTSYENLITQLNHEHNVFQMNGLHGLAKKKFLETNKKNPDYYEMSSRWNYPQMKKLLPSFFRFS
jgi:ankyrin repeat protein